MEKDDTDLEYRPSLYQHQVWKGAGFYKTTEDDLPVGLILHPNDVEFPYLSQDDRYRKDALVRRIRGFTAEEILSIIDDGIWPENV